MLARRRWWGKAAVLLAMCASGVGASSPPPVTGAAWTADSDDKFLLDVNIRQLRLGDGVRAYNTPEGTCVVLGDFLATLDVPMRIDIGAKTASGWAFTEKNRIAIDYGAMRATYRDRSEAITPGTIRETPDGWCVQANALTRWFGITVKAMTSGSVLLLQSDAKLPVELARERALRAQRIRPAKLDLASMPRVRVPYRLWRSPALDFVVSAGMTYRAKDGVKVDRQSSVYAAGEIATLSYDASLSTNRQGLPSALRIRAYRSDPDGHLLGPAKATHFGVGDVEGFDSKLSGSSAFGRGAVITNRPLVTQATFDTTRFEGDLPVGWDAELYRNDELLGFSKSDGSQRYVFNDVKLLYGENRVRIVLYGPQGEIRTREELVNVGQDNVPPGKTWYWAGLNQPGRDIITLNKPPDGTELPRAQAAVSLEHGIDTRTSVAALARAMLIDDQRVTFVEGTVRRSIGPALAEVGFARDSLGGTAARAQMIGKLGPIFVNAEAVIANDFHLQGRRPEKRRDYALSLDAPLRIGHQSIPAHAEARLTQIGDGTSQLDAAARLSANIGRFNLATTGRYRRQILGSGSDPPGEFHFETIGSGRLGPVRLRGSTDIEVAPRARLRTAELSGYWSASDRVDWEGALAYDSGGHRARARLSHIRRVDRFGLAVTAEAATDRSFALGFSLNFSLDPGHGLHMSRLPLAQAGSIRATVYRDLNSNGLRDASEPVEKGVLITTGTRQSTRTTDSNGQVTVDGLAVHAPLAVGIDESSLGDPMLVPKTPVQMVVPRPGVAADVEIGLVGGGDVEGAVVKNGGLGFEGLDLEIVDASGKVAGATRTDFDGFFLFERVAYGRYTIRVSKESADAANIVRELGLSIEITPDRSIIRAGSITAVALPRIAALSQ